MKHLKPIVAVAACLTVSVGCAHALPAGQWNMEIAGIVVDSETGDLLSGSCPFDLAGALTSVNPPVLRGLSAGPNHVSLYSVQADGPVYFNGPDGREYFWMHSHYTLSATRDVRLAAGMTVSGWAEFGSYDWVGYGDYASVCINGNLIWRFDLNDLGTPPGGDPDDPFASKAGPLQHWSFTAPEDGLYSVSLSIYGDDQLDSWVTFGNVRVPDAGTTLSLLGIALAGVFGWAQVVRRPPQ